MIGPSDPEEAKQSAPSSIRAKLGKDELRNAIHAASSTEKARAEIMLAFGDELKFDDDGEQDYFTIITQLLHNNYTIISQLFHS